MLYLQLDIYQLWISEVPYLEPYSSKIAFLINSNDSTNTTPAHPVHNQDTDETESAHFEFWCESCDKAYESFHDFTTHMKSSHSSSPYFPCLDCNIAFYCITDLEAHIGNDHSDLFIPQSPWAKLLFWQNLLDEGTAQTGNNFVCLNVNIITCKSNIKVVFNIILSSIPGRTSWKKGLLKPKLHLCA